MKTKKFLASVIALTAMVITSCDKASEGPQRAPVKEQVDTTENNIRITAEEDWDGIIEYHPNH